MNETDLLDLASAILPWCTKLATELVERLQRANQGGAERIRESRRHTTAYYSDLLSHLVLIESSCSGRYAEIIPQKTLCKILACLESRVSNEASENWPRLLGDNSGITHEYAWRQELIRGDFCGLQSIFSQLCEKVLIEFDLQWFGSQLQLETDNLQEQGAIVYVLEGARDELELWRTKILVNNADLGILYSNISLPENPTNPPLLTRLYEALSDHWNCTCIPPKPHRSVLLQLNPYRNTGPMPNAGSGLALLCSTGLGSKPWRQTEVWIGN